MQELFPEEVDSAILVSLRQVIKQLKEQGATVLPVSLPSIPHALSTYYVLSSAEAASNLAKYDGMQYGSSPAEISGTNLTTFSGHRVADDLSEDATKRQLYAATRSQGFGQEVRKRILLGNYALTAE